MSRCFALLFSLFLASACWPQAGKQIRRPIFVPSKQGQRQSIVIGPLVAGQLVSLGYLRMHEPEVFALAPSNGGFDLGGHRPYGHTVTPASGYSHTTSVAGGPLTEPVQSHPGLILGGPQNVPVGRGPGVVKGPPTGTSNGGNQISYTGRPGVIPMNIDLGAAYDGDSRTFRVHLVAAVAGTLSARLETGKELIRITKMIRYGGTFEPNDRKIAPGLLGGGNVQRAAPARASSYVQGPPGQVAISLQPSITKVITSAPFDMPVDAGQDVDLELTFDTHLDVFNEPAGRYHETLDVSQNGNVVKVPVTGLFHGLRIGVLALFGDYHPQVVMDTSSPFPQNFVVGMKLINSDRVARTLSFMIDAIPGGTLMLADNAKQNWKMYNGLTLQPGEVKDLEVVGTLSAKALAANLPDAQDVNIHMTGVAVNSTATLSLELLWPVQTWSSISPSPNAARNSDGKPMQNSQGIYQSRADYRADFWLFANGDYVLQGSVRHPLIGYAMYEFDSTGAPISLRHDITPPYKPKILPWYTQRLNGHRDDLSARNGPVKGQLNVNVNNLPPSPP